MHAFVLCDPASKREVKMSLSLTIFVVNKQGRGGECCKNKLLKAKHTENHQPIIQNNRKGKWLYRVASESDTSI